MRELIDSIEREFRRYQLMGQQAMQQLDETQLNWTPFAGGNSVAVIVWHITGNFQSRFTGFLTTDGEKPWRDRDSEFTIGFVQKDTLVKRWNEGWDTLFTSLGELRDDQLMTDVLVRGCKVAVHDALHRALAHASYHVGQIVFLGHQIRGNQWRWLTIPPGGSAAYNASPSREKGPDSVRPLQ
jgi:hypothetical protein